MRLVGLAIALALTAAAPSRAASGVGAIVYDEGRQAFSIETAGVPLVQTKRLINPDRVVIDLYDSTLAKASSAPISVRSRKIRNYRIMQYNPSIVRIVVELLPGVEPLVALRQKPGQVSVTFEDPLPPKGEKDLETLPPVEMTLPSEALTLEPVLPRPQLSPSPLPSPIPTPVPTPEPTPLVMPLDRPMAWPSEPPRKADVLPTALRGVPKLEGFGSTVLLRWQQVEALEDYGAATGPVFGYPTGLNGVAVRHWFSPWVGFGLNSRLLTYDLTVEGIRQNRTDLSVLPQLVARYPMLGGKLEPEVSLGYLGRHRTNSSALPGSSLPFTPTAFHHGLSVGAGTRVRLAPSLSLQLDYHYRPAVGGNLFKNFGMMDYGTIFPLAESYYEVALCYDLGPGYLTIGYSDETSKNRSISYANVLTGVLAGVGLRY